MAENDEKTTITLEMDPLAAFKQAQQEARERGMSGTDIAIERLQGVLGGLDDMARLTANGFLLGWADEAAARAESARRNIPYEEALSLEQFKTEQARARAGNLGTGLEMAASIPTGGVGYKIGTTALRQTSPLLRYTAPGAVGGGVAGAGYSEPGERLKGAAIGATVGAGTGAAIPVGRAIGRGVADFAGGLRRRVFDPTGESTAGRKLSQAMARDEITPQQMAARVKRMGPRATPLDVGGPNVQGLGTALARTGDKRIRSTLSMRQAGQSRRVNDMLRRNLGVEGREYADELSDIVDRRAAQAQVDYDAARDAMREAQGVDVPVFSGDRLRWLVDNSEDIQEAVRRAQRLPEFRGYSPYSWQIVDRAYKYVGDQANDLRKAGRGNQARDIDNLRLDLRAQILRENPEYEVALNNFSSASDMEDAILAGRRFMKDEVEVTRDVLDRMSDLEKEMFRIGVAREARKMTQGAGTAWESDAVRILFKNPERVRMLEPVFPSRKAFMQFVREVIPEERQYKTFKDVYTGSPSAQRLEEQAASGVTPIARDIAEGNRANMIERGIRAGQEALAPTTQEIRSELAKMLTPRTPQELDRALQMVQAQRTSPSLRRELAKALSRPLRTGGSMVEAAAPVESAILAEEYLGGS